MDSTSLFPYSPGQGGYSFFGAPSAPSAPTMPGVGPTDPRGTNPSSPTTFGTVQDYLKGPSASDLYGPGTNAILDLLKTRGDQTRARAVSEASALASRRGLAGSSTEQFGVAQAGTEADKATIDSQINVLQTNLQMAQQRMMAGAQLSSDELASLRNWDFALKNLQLQKELGQQGIDSANKNIDTAKDIANKQGQYGLIGSIGSILASRAVMGGGGVPGVPGAGGSGFSFSDLGSRLGGLFGGGGVSPASGVTGAEMPGISANPLSIYGGGAGGIGTGGVAAPGGFGAGGFGSALPFLGAGFMGNRLGAAAFGDNRYTNIGSVAGGVAGSFFGPAGTGVGSFLGSGAGALYNKLSPTQRAIFAPFLDPGNTVKQIGGGLSKAVKHIFRF